MSSSAPGLRPALLLAHRWVGLSLAVFLTMAGLTGAALAFFGPLDRALNPELYAVSAPQGQAAPLPPVALLEAALAQDPGVTISSLRLGYDGAHAVRYWVSAAEGRPAPGYDELFVDPWTGEALGTRRWADLSEGRPGVMPFLLKLHVNLALGEVGATLMGGVALLWLLDSFVGLALTAPPRGPSPGAGRWLQRWRRAWWVSGRRLPALLFTGHRALGLWAWAVMICVAWSAVGLTWGGDVQRPVVAALLGAQADSADLPRLSERRPPTLSFAEALPLARARLAEEAARADFNVERLSWLRYSQSTGTWQLRAVSSLDTGDELPGTIIWVDDATGRLVQRRLPTGYAAGDTLTTWVDALHFGVALGGLGRLITVATGVAVATLSLSGAWLWWRRRRRATPPPSNEQEST